MKRAWLGVGLLLAMLALGVAVTVAVEGVCQPITQKLTRAGEAARAEDWQEAETLRREAQGRWDRYRKGCAAVTDHAPMEEIDAIFAALEACAMGGDSVAYAQYCAQLASMVEAVAEAQAVNWWNVF